MCPYRAGERDRLLSLLLSEVKSRCCHCKYESLAGNMLSHLRQCPHKRLRVLQDLHPMPLSCPRLGECDNVCKWADVFLIRVFGYHQTRGMHLALELYPRIPSLVQEYLVDDWFPSCFHMVLWDSATNHEHLDVVSTFRERGHRIH
jgi:hypothetical protein